MGFYSSLAFEVFSVTVLSFLLSKRSLRVSYPATLDD